MFVMRRLGLSGREYRKSSRKALIRRLHRLDEKATFRFTSLPAELREQVYEEITSLMDLKRLLLVSKQIHSEAEACFYKNTRFRLTTNAHAANIFSLTAGNHVLRGAWQPSNSPNLIETIQLWRYLFAHIRHLTVHVLFGNGLPYNDDRIPCLRANHDLFSLCAFYAFGSTTPSLEDLKILLGVHDNDTLDEIGSDKLQLCFWPLKLLVGKVPTIDFPASQQDPFKDIALVVNDVGSEMNTACARYVSSVLTTHLPVRRVLTWIWKGQEEVKQESKLDLLREFISQDSATLLERFVNHIDPASGWNDGR